MTKQDQSAVDPFRQTREWIMGDSAQKEYARKIAKAGGYVVLPTYGMDDVSAATKAPVLFVANGLLIAPDILLCSPKKNMWQDVKAKSVPTWYRKKRRWEHGFDYSCAEEYLAVQNASGIRVGIVVHESRSPQDSTKESQLTGPAGFLFITLNDALLIGDHRKDWPGGAANPKRRGRRGMGGLLWDRSQMQIIRFGTTEPSRVERLTAGAPRLRHRET